jgi:transcriptional regulator with XRE-family HTH domain
MDTTVNLDKAKIKARREELRLTMREAAERSGMLGRQKWNAFENARAGYAPRLDTLGHVARALQCSIADLVTEPYPPRKRHERTTRTS